MTTGKLQRAVAVASDGPYRNAALELALSAYNAVVGSEPYAPPTDSADFEPVRDRALDRTDIGEHLPTLFAEAIESDPSTIVELGVRGGESTAAFEAVARRCGADLVSVDVDETTHDSDYERWHFVQSDDVEFADRFEDWCSERGVDPAVDALFVDTSHLYEHTVAELDAWLPKLAADGVALFHDTNLRPLGRRRDGTLHTAWDNDRGVIRAIEERLGTSLDETRSFTTVHSGYLVDHEPYCNGLTVLRRIDASDGVPSS